MLEDTFAYDVVLSHKSCSDGTVASWCIWRSLPDDYKNKLAQEGGLYSYKTKKSNMSEEDQEETGFIHPNSPEGALLLQEKGFPLVFVFVQHSENIPIKLILNKRILIIDVDLGDNLIQVIDLSDEVLLIDHHESTLKTLAKHKDLINNKYKNKFNTYINTTKKESAASLTWKLTHDSPKMPGLIDVIRVADTWSWNDNKNAEFIIKSLIMKRAFRSFPEIENVYKSWDKKYLSYVNNGKCMIEHENFIVKKIAKQADLGYIQTYDGKIYTIAYVQCNIMHSEVGSMMKWYAEKRFKTHIDFCATWKYASHKNVVSVSLRNSESYIDLSDIARNVKGSNGLGGGHSGASSFFFNGLENFHNFILKTHPLFSTVYY